MFHTVAVWRWGSDPETGNFVPPGETAPAKLAESRVYVVWFMTCMYSIDLQANESRESLSVFVCFRHAT